MNSTTFSILVAAAADYFFIALKATEDFDSFLRTVRDGMREAAAKAVAECIERFDREAAAQLPRSWELKDRPSRTMITIFSKVTYARSRYRDEHGRSRYPVDEILGIPKRKRLILSRQKRRMAAMLQHACTGHTTVLKSGPCGDFETIT